MHSVNVDYTRLEQNNQKLPRYRMSHILKIYVLLLSSVIFFELRKLTFDFYNLEI